LEPENVKNAYLIEKKEAFSDVGTIADTTNRAINRAITSFP